jgi:glutamate synthase (NADPH/NADH) large chain
MTTWRSCAHRAPTPTASSAPAELDICYPLAWGKEGVEAARLAVRRGRERGAQSGSNILIVSDRKVGASACRHPGAAGDLGGAPAPGDARACAPAGLVVETGSAREVHHFALLAGYGAEASTPIWRSKRWPRWRKRWRCRKRRTTRRQALHQGGRQGPDEGHVQDGHLDLHVLYRRADLRSHRPAEAPGRQVLHRHLDQVEGIGVFEVAEEAIRLHQQAFGDDPVLANMLDAGGEYAYRIRGEEHMWTPDAIAKLQHSTRANKYDTYKEYAQDHQRPDASAT